MNNNILISGAGGMDGTYLSKYLLDKGYNVIGIVRRSSSDNLCRLNFLKDNNRLHIVHGDVTDANSIREIVKFYKPKKFFALAAMSYVKASWDTPTYTMEVNVNGVINCLEAVRHEMPDCKFYTACSSEIFANQLNEYDRLNENTPFSSASPYSTSKIAAYYITQTYRESYGLFASNGILFNHEGSLRSDNFVTRKITKSLARIVWGLQKTVRLGNIEARRDWSHSKDMVRGMDMILDHDKPDDFVLASGSAYSVRQFLMLACKRFNLDFDKILEIDRDCFRPKDVEVLIGDASKAKKELGWETTISFEQLVNEMCDYDYYMESPHQEYKDKALQLLFK